MGEVFVFGEVGICCSVRLSRPVGGWGALGIMPCTSAEIPPAGAPSGFDSAAVFGFGFAFAPLCRSAQNDTEGMAFCEI